MHRRTFMTVLAASHLAACSRPASHTLRGVTMGTTYAITLPGEAHPGEQAALQAQIERSLDAIVGAMSTYDRHAELSQLNRARATDWQPVSLELFTVLDAALRAGAASRGAFDVTVGSLVELWGFGPALRNPTVPAASSIELVRTRVGHHRLRVDRRSRAVARLRPDVQLDLSSIAKGYAVDRIASLLEARGARSYLVEIGGEIRARTDNSMSAAQPYWRIGIDAPSDGPQRTASIVRLARGAIATSGNYRDFVEHAGRRYPHVINPLSGRPVDHPPLSVSVVSPTAMQADALATALLVMGPDAGFRFAAERNVRALFIGLDGAALTTRATGAMQPLLVS